MDFNIGIIGTGSIAIAHLISLKEIIESKLLFNKYGIRMKISGMCDINSDKIHQFKTKDIYNAEIYTTNPEKLIKNEKINVLYITTPTKFHKDLFIKAAEAKKSIFIEKPLAFELDDIKEMMTIQKKNGVFCQVGLVLRHCPFFWMLKDIIVKNKDELGSNLGFIFRDDQEWPIGTFSHASTWRKDPTLARAGCLYEHSIHDVDMLEFLFCDTTKLSKLSANIRYLSSLAKEGLEDSAIVNLEYGDGVSGSLSSFWHRIPRDERRIEIFFENGCIILDGYQLINFNSFLYYLKKKKKKIKSENIISKYFEKLQLPLTKFSFGAYFFENLAFIESLIKEENPYPDLQIGLRAHQIIEAAYKSSRDKKEIFIDF
ncbi:MAG: gfo/Idh/MocA family oxidoreductase [Candidatus Lokiarchaeota archaeon]|nr:gfo/Idh/MocA family oxidoreductase [Candidatus Lokiarchaeota archaeon]